MKNLPADIKAQAIYNGFLYTAGIEKALPGHEWKALAKQALSEGGRIERDQDGDVAIYGAGINNRIAEVYPS